MEYSAQLLRVGYSLMAVAYSVGHVTFSVGVCKLAVILKADLARANRGVPSDCLKFHFDRVKS